MNKISVLIPFLLIGLFIACNTDQEGPMYTVQGVTFSSGALTSVVVSPNNPTFTVDVFRANADAAENGNLSIKAILGDKDKTPLAGCTVSGYSFAAGETMTTVTVNVEPLSIGIELNVTLTINSEEIAVGGTKQTTLTVSKDYNWQPLGKGTFTDNWAIGVTYNVDILKAEGFERYRVIAPYAESMIKDDGNNGNWLASSSAPYVDFWTVDGTKEVIFNTFFIGLNYQGVASQPINAYYPPVLNPEHSGANSKWLDDKTVQLAPRYYITGVGGWNFMDADEIIVITLP